MRFTKRALLVGAVSACLVLVTGVVAFAAGSGTATRTSMATTLAQKLGVSSAAVTGAFDEMRQERETQRLETLKTELQSAVDAKKITDAQRDTILAKMTEISKKQAEVTKLNGDLRQWAEDNDVDLPSIVGGAGPGGRGMMGGPGAGRGGFGGP